MIRASKDAERCLSRHIRHLMVFWAVTCQDLVQRLPLFHDASAMLLIHAGRSQKQTMRGLLTMLRPSRTFAGVLGASRLSGGAVLRSMMGSMRPNTSISRSDLYRIPLGNRLDSPSQRSSGKKSTLMEAERQSRVKLFSLPLTPGHVDYQAVYNLVQKCRYDRELAGLPVNLCIELIRDAKSLRMLSGDVLPGESFLPSCFVSR